MKQFSGTGLFIAVALSASACGGDYWLGGRGGRRHDGRDGGREDAAIDGRADGAAGDRVLDGDIVLSGDQDFELAASGGAPCRVVGNGHRIRTQDSWTGRLAIRGCTLTGLGSASQAAIELELSERAQAVIEGNTFDASGAIHLTNWDESSTVFRDNVILESSLADLDPSFDASTPAFLAEGSSPAAKVFAGNRVRRSMCWFRSPNWTIGGDRDADSNLIAGLRAGIVLGAPGLVVRGNYVHNLRYPDAGDESALAVIYGTSDVLAEHNVLRGGTWVIRGFGGELRYNAVLDVEYGAWLSQPFEDTKVHHDLFLLCTASQVAAPSGIAAGIHLVNDRASGIEIFNNTLDGGGRDMRLTGAPLTIDEGCMLASFRSNLVMNVPYRRNDGGAAAVRPGILESVEPPPPRIEHADYNLFYNPDAEQIRNYAVSVAGKTVRADEGFGLHDARAFGPIDQQVDPGLVPTPDDCFPWSDEQILDGEPSVSAMLAALRAGHEPASASVVLGAGDPADGINNWIGALGDGSDPADRFAAFGR